MKIDWLVVLRDVLIVLAVSGLGGFVAEAVLGGDGSQRALALSRILLIAAGFCVCGCLVKTARFRHLAIVAVGVWLGGTALNLPLGDRTLTDWIMSVLVVLLAMLLGGLASLAIVRTRRDPPSPQT